MMTSLFLPDMLQTDKTYIFCTLRPITVDVGIWGHILLLIGHIASKRQKSSNDDVINLRVMMEGYTFSSTL